MRTTRWLAMALAAALLTVPALADEMQDAMDRADALNLFRQINLQPSQARQMVPILQRIQQLVDGYNAERTRALNNLSPTLQRARQQLVAGEQLSQEMVAALENYQQQREAARQALYRSVDAQMQAIAEILTPEQNQFLDWTAPAAIRPQECMEERLKMQQIAMGRIQEAAQMLDAVKHLHAFNFVTGRGPIVNDYLALYFDPDARQFEQAYQMVIQYTDQVRMISEGEWQARSLEIAAGLVEELGLMPTMDPGQRPGTVPWSTLFRLMTNSETVEVVRGMSR